MLTGIDVSKWQGAIDWPKVAAAGAKFAIAKASEGTTHKDRTFVTNWQGAKAAGRVCGAYHFYKWGQPASEQADNFLAQVWSVHDPGDPGLFALDLEWNDGEYVPPKEQALEALEWLRIVEHDLKRQCLVYTNAAFWRACGDPEGFSDRPLWVAHYTDATTPKLPKGWTRHAIWQYAADASTGFQGTIDGVTGDVDMNWFNGDEVALARLASEGSVPLAARGGEPVPRPELQANVVAALQRAFNPFAASFGVAQLAVDGILGPKTRAAMKLAGL